MVFWPLSDSLTLIGCRKRLRPDNRLQERPYDGAFGTLRWSELVRRMEPARHSQKRALNEDEEDSAAHTFDGGRRCIGCLSLAAGSILLSSPPDALAVTWKYTMRTDDGDPGGLIHFQPHGDYVQVCDIEADAWSVLGYVSVDQSNIYYILSEGGRCLQ